MSLRLVPPIQEDVHVTKLDQAEYLIECDVCGWRYLMLSLGYQAKNLARDHQRTHRQGTVRP